jgi:hypothetical protein
MNATVTAFRAETLTPFYYHGLYSPDGAATHPDVISDTALCFALAYAFGIPPTPRLRTTPDYREDLRRLPWRASLALGSGNRNLGPVRHIIDVEREGGYTVAMQKAMGSGLYKKTFYVHEVAPGATYQGILYGPDPFAFGEELIVRVGVGRTGLLRMERAKEVSDCRLNSATARLFGQVLPEEGRILDTIRLSRPYPPDEAAEVLASWH